LQDLSRKHRVTVDYSKQFSAGESGRTNNSYGLVETRVCVSTHSE